MVLYISALDHSRNATQELHSDVRVLPEGSVLLGVLKSVESELTSRDLLGLQGHNSIPWWFLAETERNIFLWRNGKSLDDHRDYTFWIDVPALIAKRREQLGKPHGFNPFINPLGGSHPMSERSVDEEMEYLDTFEDLSATILRHAEALSHASETVRIELSGGTDTRTPVVLPGEPKATGPRTF
jgi:hypothetical protein